MNGLVNGEDASGAITQTEVEGLDIIPSHIGFGGSGDRDAKLGES